jgi:hypothetical protein
VRPNYHAAPPLPHICFIAYTHIVIVILLGFWTYVTSLPGSSLVSLYDIA